MPEKIKVALVGLGNCFSGLIQGIEYYSKNPSQKVTGIIHENLRDYTIHDIEFVAGFDVGANNGVDGLGYALFNKDLNIYAFEANPELVKKILFNKNLIEKKT
mgnify:CR=1 FL=1